MSNGKRSIAFVLAFMTAITLLVFILPSLSFIDDSIFSIVFPNILFFLFVIGFAFIQHLFRFVVTSKYFVMDKLLFDVKLNPNKNYNRMISYFFAILLFIWPFIRGESWNNISIHSIISFIFWILIIELFLEISYRYTKMYFMTDGVLIKGLDLRLDIPMNDEIRSHSGFYPYIDISSFSLEGTLLKLYLYQDRGLLEAIVPEDKTKAVEVYLQSKKI